MENLNNLIEEIKIQLENSNDDLNVIKDIKVKLLGKKGVINAYMAKLKGLDPSEIKEKAKSLNLVKKEASDLINSKIQEIEAKKEEQKILSERIDVTASFDDYNVGTNHITNIVADYIKDLFIQLGFSIESASHIDSDKNNFEDLNITKSHPARDMQDTFYIDANTLLRTHTTNTTSKMLKQNEGEFKYATVGKVFRRDSDDATHSHQFMQIEGACISKTASVAELKGTLSFIAKKLFGEDLDTRIRPSYFPFTEPSIELDVECSNCYKKGCAKCKNSG